MHGQTELEKARSTVIAYRVRMKQAGDLKQEHWNELWAAVDVLVEETAAHKIVSTDELLARSKDAAVEADACRRVAAFLGAHAQPTATTRRTVAFLDGASEAFDIHRRTLQALANEPPF
jgi:hypothetical protein